MTTFISQSFTSKMCWFFSKVKAKAAKNKRKRDAEWHQREDAYYETLKMTGGTAIAGTVPFDERPVRFNNL